LYCSINSTYLQKILFNNHSNFEVNFTFKSPLNTNGNWSLPLGLARDGEFKTPCFAAAEWVLVTSWIEIQKKSKKPKRCGGAPFSKAEICSPAPLERFLVSSGLLNFNPTELWTTQNEGGFGYRMGEITLRPWKFRSPWVRSF
jgi:hypothetical protein